MSLCISLIVQRALVTRRAVRSDVFQDLNKLFSLYKKYFLKLPVVNFNFLGFTVKGTGLLKKRKDDFRVLIHYIILYYIILYYIILYLCNSLWTKSELCGRNQRPFKPFVCGNVHITGLVLEHTVVVLKFQVIHC
jgi:hypothetical protein